MELSRRVNVFGRQSGVLGIPEMAHRDRNVRLSFLFPGSQSKHLSMLWGLGGPVKSAMEAGPADYRLRCTSLHIGICHSERSGAGVRTLISIRIMGVLSQYPTFYPTSSKAALKGGVIQHPAVETWRKVGVNPFHGWMSLVWALKQVLNRWGTTSLAPTV